jgi:hypothetical protein
MICIRPLCSTLMHIIAVCCGLLLWPFVGLAAGEDSRLDISADGTSVDFDLHQVARREVVDRLFADRGIQLDWLNRDVADEPIRGRFRGTRSAVARQMLAPLDFVLAVDRVDGEVRITRVVVVGRSSGEASSGLGVLEAAMRRAEGRQDLPREDRAQAKPSGAIPMPPGASPVRPLVMTGAGAANLPTPTPIRSGDPAAVPVPLPVPPNVPPPTPQYGPLPSIAPIVGADVPMLPGPRPVIDAK